MKYFKNLVKPYLVWSFIVILVPIFMIFLYAVTNSGNSLINIQFTFNNFAKFVEPVYLEVFITSIEMGLITVAICLLLGYTMAYIISKKSERTQSFLILLVTIPMWINMLIRIYAWKSILEPLGLMHTDLQLW